MKYITITDHGSHLSAKTIQTIEDVLNDMIKHYPLCHSKSKYHQFGLAQLLDLGNNPDENP